MGILRSKEALVLLLGYDLLLTLVNSGFTRPDIFEILLYMIYSWAVLLSRPWHTLTSHERWISRLLWSIFVTRSSLSTVWFIVSLMDMIDGGRVKGTVLVVAIGFFIIAGYIYVYRKKSESYLETALKDGGFKLF